MGSGKTTIGRAIAEILEMPFIDLDDYITSNQDKTVKQIFADEGEAYFRDLETNAIKDLLYTSPIVISLGGGAPCYNNNMQLLKNTGTCIYLKAGIDVLLDRLLLEKAKRPIIADIESKEELSAKINDKLLLRARIYEQAHYHINVERSISEITKEITSLSDS